MLEYYNMFFRRSRHTQSHKALFIIGSIVSLGILCGMSLACITAPASAITITNGKNCDGNAVVWCGFNTTAQLDNYYHANGGDGHNTSASIQRIYAHFGIDSSDIDNLKDTGVNGYVTNTGDVYTTVNGQTTLVATNALTAGRELYYDSNHQPLPGQTQYSVDGTPFVVRAPAVGFASGVQALAAVVSMKNGVFQFAIFNSCGNPVSATPKTTPPPKTPAPTYSCAALNKVLAAGKVDTYQFTTSAPVANGAVVDHVVYSFGDGSSQTETNPSTIVTHLYNPSKSDTYIARTTVYVKLPNGQTVTATSNACRANTSVQTPYCVELTGPVLDKNKMEYSFTAMAAFGAGIKFTGADFTFGDGNSKNNVAPANGSTSVTYVYAYAKPGNYNANAVLHFSVDGNSVSAPPCSALVTPNQPIAPECKPGVPLGSAACNPCPTDASVPVGSPQCAPLPPGLPNTGAGDTIAIFAVVLVAGFLVYRQLIFRKHRAAFLAAQNGTSQLPLQDPLESESNLHIVPRTSRRGLSRRRRQF